MKFLFQDRFPVWQVTFPLSIVLIFAVGAITTIFLVQGRYLFDLEASPHRIKITTDVDKREVPIPQGEVTEQE